MSHAASAIDITADSLLPSAIDITADSLLPGSSLSEGKGGHCVRIGWRTLNQMKRFASLTAQAALVAADDEAGTCPSVSTDN